MEDSLALLNVSPLTPTPCHKEFRFPTRPRFETHASHHLLSMTQATGSGIKKAEQEAQRLPDGTSRTVPENPAAPRYPPVAPELRRRPPRAVAHPEPSPCLLRVPSRLTWAPRFERSSTSISTAWAIREVPASEPEGTHCFRRRWLVAAPARRSRSRGHRRQDQPRDENQ